MMATSLGERAVTTGSATQEWNEKLTILERFNGRTFNPVPSGSRAITVNLWTVKQNLLQQSYEVLKGSVYQSLALQTRLKPYFLNGRESVLDAANDLNWRMAR